LKTASPRGGPRLFAPPSGNAGRGALISELPEPMTEKGARRDAASPLRETYCAAKAGGA